MTLPPKRRRRPLPSADAIAGNEDLITEIFKRLPTKSVCRFKSVSKQWYSLISFLRMPNSVSGFFLSIGSRSKNPIYKYIHLAGKRPRCASTKSLTFVKDPMGIKIIHSCNGLFLCSSSATCPNPNYYIYNPTTKQFAIIPPPCDLVNKTVSSMTFAFDPSRHPHYKIVSVVSTRFSWMSQIEIYSSDTGAWKHSGNPHTEIPFQDLSDGVFFNGSIHWVSLQSNTSIRFDVDRECLGTMPTPTVYREIRVIFSYFAESGGHLHFICGYHCSSPFDVLELESDYSKWFVKYRVDLDYVKRTIPFFPHYPPFFSYSILYLVRGEVEEESYVVLYIPGMVASYNFKDKTLKKLCDLELSDNAESMLTLGGLYGGCSNVHQYIETHFCI